MYWTAKNKPNVIKAIGAIDIPNDATAKAVVATAIPESKFVTAELALSETDFDITDNLFAFNNVTTIPATTPTATKSIATGNKEEINKPNKPVTTAPNKVVVTVVVNILFITEKDALAKFSREGFPLKLETANFLSLSWSYFWTLSTTKFLNNITAITPADIMASAGASAGAANTANKPDIKDNPGINVANTGDTATNTIEDLINIVVYFSKNSNMEPILFAKTLLIAVLDL